MPMLFAPICRHFSPLLLRHAAAAAADDDAAVLLPGYV